MEELHCIALRGHLGVCKLYHALELWVWWSAMHSTISSYVAGCSSCQHIKDSMQCIPGLLQPLPIPPFNFKSWSLGLSTNLPLYHGCNAVFTCMDRLTKLCRLDTCFLGGS